MVYVDTLKLGMPVMNKANKRTGNMATYLFGALVVACAGELNGADPRISFNPPSGSAIPPVLKMCPVDDGGNYVACIFTPEDMSFKVTVSGGINPTTGAQKSITQVQEQDQG